MGSSGGGGSSGGVDYPAYIKTAHELMLGNFSGFTSDIKTLVDTAMLNSPFATAVAYDSSADTSDMVTAVSDLTTVVGTLPGAVLGSLVTESFGWAPALIPDSVITDAVNAHSALLETELNDTVLPQFRSGMRDVGMVNTSAFALGEAYLWGKKASEVAKLAADLRVQQAQIQANGKVQLFQIAVNSGIEKVKLQEGAARLRAEVRRMKIVASSEESQQNVAYEEADERWPFDVMAHAGNLLGSVAGTAVSTKTSQSTTQSVLSGALGGAAMGAAGGGGWGALGGGLLGGLGGLF